MAFGRQFVTVFSVALSLALAASTVVAQDYSGFVGSYRHDRQGDLPQIDVTLFPCDGYLCADGATDSSQWKAACIAAGSRAQCNIAGRRSVDGLSYEGTSEFQQQGDGLLFQFNVVYENGRRFNQSLPLARVVSTAPLARPSPTVGTRQADEVAGETLPRANLDATYAAPQPTLGPSQGENETVIIESDPRPTAGAVAPSGLGRAAATINPAAELGLVKVKRPEGVPPGVRVFRHPSGRGIAFAGTVGARRDDWRWATARDGQIPAGAYPAARHLAGPAYVCRAPHRGGIHPGYLPPGGTACHIVSGGRHYRMKTYAVLTGGSDDFAWQRSQSATAPADGVLGSESGGETYLICRSMVGGVELIGKLENGVCRIGFEGREETASSYEILVGQ
jgi:hypothetical protein